jgi:hypothetical protein
VSVGYRQVAVLSISWSNDTMGVKTTEQELLNVFKKYMPCNCYFYLVAKQQANYFLHYLVATILP